MHAHGVLLSLLYIKPVYDSIKCRVIGYVYLLPFDVGRLCVGIYQGAQMALFRTYLGETSATVISTLPPEKRKKSTIKYNNFLIAFTVGTTCVAVGPG